MLASVCATQKKEATVSEMVHIHRFERHGRNKEFVPLDEYRILRDERDRLAELVRQAQPHVCSLLCPSVKARHELWTHTKLCLNMQAVLTPAKGVQQHPAFDEYGEHRQPTGLGDL